MVVLAVFNASSRADGRPTRRQIWAGQCLGSARLVIISLVAALGLSLVPEIWVWLGLLPPLLGLRKLVPAIQAALRAQNSRARVSPPVATGRAGAAGLTIANGGDNIAAYTPVFRTLDADDLAVTLVVFALGVALCCKSAAFGT